MENNVNNEEIVNEETVSETEEVKDETSEETTEFETADDGNDLVYITGGDKNCYCYFSMQYTGLQRNADIISLGLVTGSGRSFYAEFTDYDMNKCSGFVFENVIKKLQHPETCLDGDNWTITGTRKEISTQLWFWLNEYYVANNKPCQFVGDVCYLEFVMLQDLLLNDPEKTTMDLPIFISPDVVNLNQDIACVMQRKRPVNISDEEFDNNFVPLGSSFQIDRDEVFKGVKIGEENKYDAILQAHRIKAIHSMIWNFKS